MAAVPPTTTSATVATIKRTRRQKTYRRQRKLTRSEPIRLTLKLVSHWFLLRLFPDLELASRLSAADTISRSQVTLGEIARRFGAAYETRYGHRMRPEEIRTLRALAACRTAVCAWHRYRCDQCGYEMVVYNSCGDGHCPACQNAKRAQWLDKRRAQLLPVPYFHTIVPLPSELSRLALYNRRLIYGLLFSKAAETLKEVAASHGLAHIGFFAVLHTWGQKLQNHVHLHIVVVGGGLVLERARQAQGGRDVLMQSKGRLEVARRTVLSVRLLIDGLVVADPGDTILWQGEIGNAWFQVNAPQEAVPRECAGMAGIDVDGMRIAKLYFSIPVAEHTGATAPLTPTHDRHKRAFASYATEDRDQVLGRLQGMHKRTPSLEIFLGVLALRSGQDWEQELHCEISRSDVFYLFWSKCASESEWVDREWHWALEHRGLDFIDPVPPVDPKIVPPPPESATKHFNDWVLAFLKQP